MVFDPFVGGHVYDVGTDGSECRWSRVLVYDRPHRVVFSWDINGHWTIESRPGQVQRGRGDVRRRSGPGTTRVVLEHQHLERHGDDLLPQLEGMRTGWQEGGPTCSRRRRPSLKRQR